MAVDLMLDVMNKTNRIGYTNAHAKLMPFSDF
jgi:hypothetical protein